MAKSHAPGAGSARTPHQYLDGMITPSGLHFERHHSGIPDIDPPRPTACIQAKPVPQSLYCATAPRCGRVELTRSVISARHEWRNQTIAPYVLNSINCWADRGAQISLRSIRASGYLYTLLCMIFAGGSMGVYYSQALTVPGPKNDFDRFFDVFFTKDDSGQPAGIAIDKSCPRPRRYPAGGSLAR